MASFEILFCGHDDSAGPVADDIVGLSRGRCPIFGWYTALVVELLLPMSISAGNFK